MTCWIQGSIANSKNFAGCYHRQSDAGIISKLEKSWICASLLFVTFETIISDWLPYTNKRFKQQMGGALYVYSHSLQGHNWAGGETVKNTLYDTL